MDRTLTARRYLTPRARVGTVLPRVLLAVAVGLLLGLVSTRMQQPVAVYGFAFSGAVLIHLHAFPRPMEASAVTALAAVLLVVNLATQGLRSVATAPVASGAILLGVSSLSVLALPTIWLDQPARQRRLAVCLVAATAPLLAGLTWPILRFTASLQPRTWDDVLYAIDGAFGVQPSFWIGRILWAHPSLAWASMIAYEALPLVICAAYVTDRGSRPFRLLVACAVATIAACALYAIVPASGPIHRFGLAFPATPPSPLASPGPAPLNPTPARNAMPSLHFGLALLLYWRARHQPRWIWAGWALFLGLTIISTLGLGEHYLIDLVVAVPFTLAVYAAVERVTPGWIWLAAAALTAGWLTLLRLAPAALLDAGAAAVGMAVGVTLVATWWLWRLGFGGGATLGAAARQQA